MNDRQFLQALELKLNSYTTRIRDLEVEIARLNKALADKTKTEVTEVKK
jgi:hypothetical protein